MPRALRAASTAEICGSLSAAHTPSVLQLQNNSSSFSMAPAGLGAPAPGLGARRRRPRREGGGTAQRWASPGAESFRLPWAPAPTPTPWAAPPGSALSGSAPPPGSPPPPSPCPAPPVLLSPAPPPPQVRLGSTLARGPLLRPDLRSRPRRRSPLTTPDPAVHLVRVSPGARPGAAQSGSAPPLLPAPPRPRPVPGRPLGGALRRPDALRSHFCVLSSRGAELPETPQTVPLSRGLGGYRLNPGRADVHPLTGGWTVVLGFCTP